MSSDKVTSIHALRWEPAQEAIGVVQIAHGMVEYADRYDLFAQFLTEKGFVVTANDHLGHGASVTGQEQWGYFAEKDGAGCVLQDMHKLTRLTKEAYPNIPYFLFGHSMGSFYPDAIFVSTAKNWLAPSSAERVINRLLCLRQGR